MEDERVLYAYFLLPFFPQNCRLFTLWFIYLIPFCSVRLDAQTHQINETAQKNKQSTKRAQTPAYSRAKTQRARESLIVLCYFWFWHFSLEFSLTPNTVANCFQINYTGTCPRQ
jgi:hypothetical protein